MGIKSRRVAFTFDDNSLRTLKEMTQDGQYGSLAECVRESLQITRALHLGARQGFTEVVMRRAGSNAEQVVVIPRLHFIKERHD
jgi:Arc/MetJ-type ribon-helix-helix transcriptional regulator